MEEKEKADQQAQSAVHEREAAVCKMQKCHEESTQLGAKLKVGLVCINITRAWSEQAVDFEC